MPNFAGNSKTMFVPFETNEVYENLMKSNFDNIRIINERMLVNDYETNIERNLQQISGNNRSYND